MAAIQFSNDASALLAASIDNDDTVIQVDATYGALFPSPGAGQYFLVALRNANGDLEICKCTARTGDLLTVVRGQEGTSGQAWTNGQTRVELRLTKGTMEALLQKAGDTITGTIDFNGNDLEDAHITGDSTVIDGGQIVGVPIRGALDDSSNEILVPADGSDPTIGGEIIATQGNVGAALPIGTVIMWYGNIAAIPDGFQLCDGSDGTPDMRGAFPRGAGGGVALGEEGGAGSYSTNSQGAHTHAGVTGDHVLTTNELPSHVHPLWSDANTTTTSTTGLGASDAHSVAGRTANFTRGDVSALPFDGHAVMGGAGSGAAHSHSIGSDGAHTHTVTVMPPYVGLYFIMKVS